MSRQVHPEVSNLTRELAELLEPAGITAQALSRRFGYHPTYLGRVFRGENPLKVEIAFALLAHVRADPLDFFEALYPFGGAAILAARQQFPAAWTKDRELEDMRQEIRHRYHERPESPKEWALRAGVVLRSLLKRRHVSQREASLAAGYGPSVLGQAMRGASQLTFEHLFAALEVAQVPIGRYMKELFGPPEGSLLGLVRWRKTLDDAEGLTRGHMTAFADRRRAKGEPPAAAPAARPKKKPAKKSLKKPGPKRRAG